VCIWSRGRPGLTWFGGHCGSAFQLPRDDSAAGSLTTLLSSNCSNLAPLSSVTDTAREESGPCEHDCISPQGDFLLTLGQS
jgi:hypothetical protein